MTSPTSIRLPADHGLELHALEWSREGVPFVFLHGFGNDAHVWDDAAQAIAPHYRTLALDLRGHGDSDHDPEGRYDHETMAGDLEVVFAHLGFERAVVCGHSMGGRVAMRFAGARPEVLAGLVIVDSAPELDARGTTRIRLEVGSSAPSFASFAEYEAVLAKNYPVAAPATLQKLARGWLRERPDGRLELKTDSAFMRRRGSEEELRAAAEAETKALWQALEKTQCPTLVVRGAASDVMSPEVADRMVDDVLSKGRLAVIPRASHSVMIDNPEAFTRALCDFALG